VGERRVPAKREMKPACFEGRLVAMMASHGKRSAKEESSLTGSVFTIYPTDKIF